MWVGYIVRRGTSCQSIVSSLVTTLENKLVFPGLSS